MSSSLLDFLSVQAGQQLRSPCLSVSAPIGCAAVSVLGKMWEVDIARVFCRHPKYLPIFLSCNEPKVSSNYTCWVLLLAALKEIGRLKLPRHGPEVLLSCI